MKLFKTVDEKLAEIGFNKVEENKYGVRYERWNEKYKYLHMLDILYRASGRHIIQSYQGTPDYGEPNESYKGLFIVVGLSYYELKLAYKKMKQIGLTCNKSTHTKVEG